MLDVTYLRCSMTLIRWNGTTLLTDPWYRSHLRGLPCFYKPPIGLGELPQIDAVVASHLHPDHFDVRAVRSLYQKNTGMVVLAPPGTADMLGPQYKGDVTEMKWWESRELGGLKITATESHHSGYEINAFIQGPGGSLFFGGDSKYSTAFGTTRERLGGVDIALLPIGGTLVFGRRIVMSPQDAAQAAEDLGARYIVPIHEGGIWMSAPPLSFHPGRPRQLAEITDVPGSKTRTIVLEPGGTARFDTELTLIT